MLFFSNRSGGRAFHGNAGFTLLEVMVAVALIAIAFVALIGAQSQSVVIATRSKFDTMASLLAQWKITELSVQNYNELTNSTGDFGEDFPNFSWKMEVAELSSNATGIKGSDGMLKTIDLSILVDQDATLSYDLRTIVCKKMAAVK